MEQQSFIDIIHEYFSLVSDVDPLYVKWLSAQLLGHLLTKKSFVNINPEVERVNLYTLLVGDSYYARKSVTQDMISYFYPITAFLPNESSAEKFIANLSKIPNGVWLYGEYSKILKHIKRGGYLSTIAETLNDLYKYERPEYKRELMKDEYIIKEPYPTFSTTLTPEVLKEQVTPEMMDGGLFGRLMLIPGKKGKGKRESIPEKAVKLKEEIKEITNALQLSDLSCEFVFNDDSLKRLNDIEGELRKNEDIAAIAGRYGQAIIKLSAIIAFSEKIGDILTMDEDGYLRSGEESNNSNNSKKSKESNNSKINSSTDIGEDLLRITFITIITNFTILTIFDRHLNEAYEMVKPCLELARDLKEHVSMNKKFIIKAKQYIKENHPVLRSETARMCNIDKLEMDTAEYTLVDHDFLKVITFQKKKSNGALSKPIVVYCVKNSDKKCSDCEYRKYCEEDD